MSTAIDTAKRPSAFSPNDNEPKIVDAKLFSWPVIERPSIYAKYDTLKVGQAIVGVPNATCNTIMTRLKRKGMKLQAKKLDSDTQAIIRLPD